MYSIYNIKIHNNFYKFIVFSLIVHVFAVIVFSIRWYTNQRQSTKAIDVTIVHHKAIKRPNQFDFIAQENQNGGGNSQIKNAPTIDKKAIFPDNNDRTIDSNDISQTILKNLSKEISKKEHVITSNKASENKDRADESINNSEDLKTDSSDFIFQVETVPEITSLFRNIDMRRKLYAKRPRVKYLSASTKKFRDAHYLDQWRRDIEYFGNKYYPEQARIKNIAGKVVVLVAINSKGEINKINIEQSSGYKILDEAAIQILHIAAPFKQFTKEMQKDTDILEIIRTWSFNEDNNSDELSIS